MYLEIWNYIGNKPMAIIYFYVHINAKMVFPPFIERYITKVISICPFVECYLSAPLNFYYISVEKCSFRAVLWEMLCARPDIVWFYQRYFLFLSCTHEPLIVLGLCEIHLYHYHIMHHCKRLRKTNQINITLFTLTHIISNSKQDYLLLEKRFNILFLVICQKYDWHQ